MNYCKSLYNLVVSGYRKMRKCMYSTGEIKQLESELLKKKDELKLLKEKQMR